MMKWSNFWPSVPILFCLACSTASTSGQDASPTPTDGGNPPSDASIPTGGPGTVLFSNRCTQTIWVGALNNGTTTFLPKNGGWKMDPGGTEVVSLPAKWGGRFWGRTGCVFDANGKGQCESADCGQKLECAGAGGKPPASLVEFQLNGFGGKDFYDVSLVDGYNVPISVAPQAGTYTRTNLTSAYDCGAPSCTSDLNKSCPTPLQQMANGKVVGCRSANEACAVDPTNAALACATTRDLYGCVGGGPNSVSGSCYSPGTTNQCCGCPSWSPAGSCKAHNAKWESPALPETFAKPFKTACPTAYSFPYDDPTSTYTCQAATAQGVGYQITFCP